MSHDPSQASGTKAIQIDLDNLSVLSDDITTHSATAILSRKSYYIESMRRYIMVNNTGGYLASESFNGYTFAASSIRANAVASFSTVSDDCSIGCALSNASQSITTSTSGSTGISQLNYFRSFWRIS